MIKLAALVKEVAQTVSMERGAVCAVDCLLEAANGRLIQTMNAWKGFLVNPNIPTTPRHNDGAWVPAICKE